MPANTVYVGRPSRWGNPFPMIGGDPVLFPPELGVAILGPNGDEFNGFRVKVRVHSVEQSLAWYRVWIESVMRIHWRNGRDWLAPLRGKNLACWCPLDWDCHADILLELANR